MQRSELWNNGFTLIELLVVLFIIGIALSLVGVVITQKSGSLELRTTARQILATLRYARSHAISEKRVYSFVLYTDKGIYSLYTVNRGNDGEAVPVISKSVPERIHISFNESGRESIDFFPQGNSTGGIIEIKNNRDASFFIIVNRVNGGVSLRKG